jgi:hypothetical protein
VVRLCFPWQPVAAKMDPQDPLAILAQWAILA